MPSADFIALCQAKTADVRVIFNYDSTDYSDWVIDISPISRDSELTSSYVAVKLNNNAGTFNNFIDSLTALNKTAYIGIAFEGLAEEHKLFTGYCESVELDLDTVTMTIKDKFAICFANTVGSGEVPVEVDGVTRICANFVWDLLTIYAGLDDTANSSNPDIDYDAWGDWYDILDELNNEYRLSAYLTGQTVGECLKRIATMTNSYIWVKGDGKISFAHYSDGNLGSFPYTKEYCLDRRYKSTMDGVIDYVKCYYGYDKDTWEPQGFKDGQLIIYNSAMDLVEEDRTIWHATEKSATRFVAETLARFNPPLSTFEIQTAMAGFISDIANIENLLNHYDSPNDSIDIIVEQITFDLMDMECSIIGSKLWRIE